jgi:hypothetical protein
VSFKWCLIIIVDKSVTINSAYIDSFLLVQSVHLSASDNTRSRRIISLGLCLNKLHPESKKKAFRRVHFECVDVIPDFT